MSLNFDPRHSSLRLRAEAAQQPTAAAEPTQEMIAYAEQVLRCQGRVCQRTLRRFARKFGLDITCNLNGRPEYGLGLVMADAAFDAAAALIEAGQTLAGQHTPRRPGRIVSHAERVAELVAAGVSQTDAEHVAANVRVFRDKHGVLRKFIAPDRATRIVVWLQSRRYARPVIDAANKIVQSWEVERIR